MNRVRLISRDRVEAVQRGIEAKAGPTVRQRQEDLVDFYDRYEELVELLCDAAQYGPTSALERRYVETRERFAADYELLKPMLGAYLRRIAEEDGPDRSNDAFSALVTPRTLLEFLNTDDGAMISRITRTREALNLYGEHLRQLAAKAA